MTFPDLSTTPWRLICLSERQEVFTLVDADDHAWIVAAGLTYNISWGSHSRSKLYAKRNVGRDRATIRMHREIMERVDRALGVTLDRTGLVVDHKNGQSLDNRKANLRWLTKAENDRHRVIMPPSIEAIVTKLLLENMNGKASSAIDELRALEATF